MIRLLQVLVLGCSLSFASVAGATPLNLTLKAKPDIVAMFITSSYAPISDMFTASGWASQLLLESGPHTIPFAATPTFEIKATIDGAGNASAGTLTIGGTVPTLGINSGPLLTGNLTAFGFGSSTDPLEFLFNITGGQLAGYYSGPTGVILSQSGFMGSFNNTFASSAFRSNGFAVADTAPIPEPSSAFLFLAGAVTVWGSMRVGKRRDA